jgi:hypothetical protein
VNSTLVASTIIKVKTTSAIMKFIENMKPPALDSKVVFVAIGLIDYE